MRNNSMALRFDYENAAAIFAAAFGKGVEETKKEFKLTQSFLRLEQPLSTSSAMLNFPVLNNIQSAAGQFITEQRLNQQDSFIPTAMGIYVAAPASASDATFKLYSYLNPTIFGAANAAAMQVIYNGKLAITVNNDVKIPAWDVFKHWSSNQTQQTAALAAGVVVDQFYGGEDGKYPMQPYVALIGSKNIQINVFFPTAPSAITANARLCIWFDGILAQNSTVVV